MRHAAPFAALLAIAISVPSLATAQTTAPLAAYSFEDGSGTTLSDVSGNGNSMTLKNGPAWTAGHYGTGLAFDGSNDRAVARAYSSALNLTGRSLTLSAWIYPRSNSGWQMIVLKPAHASHTSPYFDWSMHRETGTGRIVGFLGCDAKQRTSNATTPLNTWTHVAITYDGTNLRHYINGVLDRATPLTCAVVNTSSQPIRIGANGGNGEVFNGSIDDVRVYNRVLTAQEIAADMTVALGGGVATPPPPDTSAPNVAISTPAAGSSITGTVSVAATASDDLAVTGVQFRLDGANLGVEDLTAPYDVSWASDGVSNGTHVITAVARDAAGNAATSAPVSVTVANLVPPPTLSVALLVAPASGSAPLNGVDLTASLSGTATGATTYSYYCNRSDTGTNSDAAADLQVTDSVQTTLSAVDLCSYNVPGTFTAKIIAERQGVAAEARKTVTVSTPAPVDTTAPTVTLTAPVPGTSLGGNLSLAADAADDFAVAGVQFRVDGVNVGSEDQTAPYGISWNSATVNDGVHAVTAAARDAAGHVTVSGAVIVLITNGSAAGPIAAYSFDEASGTVLSDTSGHGVTMDLANDPAWTTGHSGSALSFDGSNDRAVARSYNSSLDLTGGSFTLSAWINPRSNSNWQMIVLKPAHANHSAPYFDWSLHREPSTGRIVGYLGCDGAQRTSNGNAPTNRWTHVAVTYDGTALRHYINGVLDRTTAVTCAVTNTSSQPVRIGANGGNGEVFNGLIDDVRIFSRVLTAQEIQADMNAPLGGGSPPSSPDSNAPSVSIIAPASGADVAGTAMIAASASDNVGVTGVQFRLDGGNLGAEDQTAPFAVSWSSATTPNGPHALTAVARDAAGNSSVSSPVTINVANVAATPTLGVSLMATPVGGSAPINGVDLSANVSGSATGVVTYTFYCNRADSGTSVSQPWDRQVTNSSQASLTAADVCDYAQPGTYTAKVIAERAGLAAEAMTTVAVSAPPAPAQLQLTAIPASVASGAASNLSWSSVNATSCIAGGSWSGSKPTAGSAGTGPLFAATNIFLLTCSGTGGSASSTAVVTVEGATQQSGLDFQGSDSTDGTVRFKFTNPLAIYPATYIWKLYPRQQSDYYTTFFWGNDDGRGDLSTFHWDNGHSNSYYGAHPYPNFPNTQQHRWEIATDASGDFVSNELVTYNRWYTQALVAWSDGAGKHTVFYWDLPDASKVIEHVAPTSYGNTDPPAPALTFGDAPWNPSNEIMNGVLRGIQIYSVNLSLGDVLAEIATPQSTAAGASNIWYLNLNPTPTDIADKSGNGHDPGWVGSERPNLWDGQ